MPQHPKEMYHTVSSMKQDLPIFTQVEPSHFLAFLRGNLQPNTIPCLKNQHTLPSNNKNATKNPSKCQFFFNPHGFPPATTWRQFIERLFGARLGGWGFVGPDSKGWGLHFSKTIGWCKQTVWLRLRLRLLFGETLWWECISSMEYIQCRWRSMVTGMVVTQQRCCDQSPCHPATMVGILEKSILCLEGMWVPGGHHL